MCAGLELASWSVHPTAAPLREPESTAVKAKEGAVRIDFDMHRVQAVATLGCSFRRDRTQCQDPAARSAQLALALDLRLGITYKGAEQ